MQCQISVLSSLSLNQEHNIVIQFNKNNNGRFARYQIPKYTEPVAFHRQLVSYLWLYQRAVQAYLFRFTRILVHPNNSTVFGTAYSIKHINIIIQTIVVILILLIQVFRSMGLLQYLNSKKCYALSECARFTKLSHNYVFDDIENKPTAK